MLFEKVIQLLLFIWGQQVDFTRGGVSSRDEFDAMIPMPSFWKRVKGFLGKDILKVMKILRNKVWNCFRNIVLLFFFFFFFFFFWVFLDLVALCCVAAL